jgi:hypothetical protein
MIGGTSGERPSLSSGEQRGALWNSIATQYTNKSTPIKELTDPSPGRLAGDDITWNLTYMTISQVIQQFIQQSSATMACKDNLSNN